MTQIGKQREVVIVREEPQYVPLPTGPEREQKPPVTVDPKKEPVSA